MNWSDFYAFSYSGCVYLANWFSMGNGKMCSGCFMIQLYVLIGFHFGRAAVTPSTLVIHSLYSLQYRNQLPENGPNTQPKMRCLYLFNLRDGIIIDKFDVNKILLNRKSLRSYHILSFIMNGPSEQKSMAKMNAVRHE